MLDEHKLLEAVKQVGPTINNIQITTITGIPNSKIYHVLNKLKRAGAIKVTGDARVYTRKIEVLGKYKRKEKVVAPSKVEVNSKEYRAQRSSFDELCDPGPAHVHLSNEQKKQIQEASATYQETRRPCAHALDNILHTPIPVLDKGFIRVVDYMGDDSSIVQAARVSYGKGTKKVSEDVGLINYLMRHRHTTPFEMCEIKFHVKLPIFVARQWVRHRTANINEYSARYSILEREFYYPKVEDIRTQSKTNKQGRDEVMTAKDARKILGIMASDNSMCYADYQQMLDMGLTKELARANLPVNVYTQWYWKIDLHNLLHFLSLRMDPHAQFEIREYANVIYDIVKRWVPITAKAFNKYMLTAVNISGPALNAVRDMVSGEKVKKEDYNLSEREWKELMLLFGRGE